MRPDKRKIASAIVLFLSIALIEAAITGPLAMAGADQRQIGPIEILPGTVKIGAIYNLDGPQSPLDLPSANGARLAVKEINARGGIDGREIELVLCNGESDPDRVRRCAKGQIDENVSAMMGLSDTDMVMAAAPVAAAAKVPFVTSGATSPRLAEQYQGLFLASFGDNVQAQAGAEYAYKEMGLTNCILIVDGDMEYARLLAGYFKERYQGLGGEIIMEAFINGSDLESLSQAVAEERPDMIYLAAGPKEAGAAIEAMRKAGIQSPVFGGDSLDSPELKGDEMGSIVFSTHALLEEGSSRSGEFVRAYRAEYGNSPENAFSALGYDTVNLLAGAIDRAGSGDPGAIFAALSNTSGFEGVSGDISYQNGSRIPNKDVTLILLNDGMMVGSEVVTPEPSI